MVYLTMDSLSNQPPNEHKVMSGDLVGHYRCHHTGIAGTRQKFTLALLRVFKVRNR